MIQDIKQKLKAILFEKDETIDFNIKNKFRFYSEKVDENIDIYSYAMFGSITEKIIEKTNYNNYTYKKSERPSRFYISRIPFEALTFAFVYSLFIMILYMIGLAYSGSDAGILSDVLIFSNIILFFAEIILYLIDIIFFIISESTTILDEAISTEDIGETLINIARDNVIIGVIFGVVYSSLEILYLFILELLPSIDTGEIQLLPTEELREVLPESLFDIVFLRNLGLFILMPISTLIFVIYRFYGPIYTYNERQREINNILPQSYLFLYALTKGGLNIKESMRELAMTKETYGEVAVVFDDIITQAEYGNLSLQEAISNQAELTNNPELKDFLQGLSSIMETGSDITIYLNNKTEDALQQERDAQESYFNTLEMLSESYIVIFVLAPIFIVVLQLVSALTGGFNRALTQMVPYIHVPAGGFIISAIIYILGNKYTTDSQITKPKQLYQKTLDIEIYEEETFMTKLNNISRHPQYSLLVTFPILFIYYSLMIQINVVPLSISGWEEDIIQATVYGYYFPLLIILAPWSYLYEKEKKRKKQIERQLPTLLTNIQESNNRGLTIEESFTAAAEANNTPFYQQLREQLRKSYVLSNLNYALIEFANKLKTARISQSIDLITRANNVSGDVSTVMNIVTEDFAELLKLKNERQTRAKAYVAIVFVSIVVSTLVLVAIDFVFFNFLADETSGGGNGDTPEGFDTFDDIPVEFFNRVLLHTVMTLSLISGIVSGIMENNSPQNGFKYVILLTTATLSVFILMSVVF